MTTFAKVLIVDDDFDNAEVLSMMMDLGGYESRAATSVEQAVRYVQGWVPDCIVMDIGMPVDGFAVAQTVRGQPGCSGVPILAISGYGNEATREKARSEGFSGFLVKPADFDDITLAITAIKNGRLAFN